MTGADAPNTGRIYPFTGGSRFIQAGILTREEMRTYMHAHRSERMHSGQGMHGGPHPQQRQGGGGR